MSQSITDTHIHVWNFKQAKYSWLEGDTSILNRSYCIEEIENERIAAGVTQGVLVQAANNYEDTEWMLKVAGGTDWIKGVVGWLPLLQPGELNQALTEKYAGNEYFKGVRHLIHNEANDQWLLQDEALESLTILDKHNLTYDIVGVKPEHIETALKVAEKVPGLKMVFDHLNQPPIAANEKFGRWGDLMKQGAQHANLYVKISGLGTASGNLKGWASEDIKPYIGFVIEQFGTNRCICGSDWPVSLLAGSYSKTLQAYQQALTELINENDLQKVLSGNAIRFYNL